MHQLYYLSKKNTFTKQFLKIQICIPKERYLETPLEIPTLGHTEEQLSPIIFSRFHN